MTRRWWFRYSLPLIFVSLASLLAFALLKVIGVGPWTGYAYLLAIMASAWWGGYVAGVAACLLTFYGAAAIFIPGFHPSKVDPNRLGLTVLVGILVSRVAAVHRKSEELLRHANDDLEERVRRRTAELERSNAELERYAYAASHDLQEPLRMVTMYAQLLARRHQGTLDPQAHEYIRFITTGSQRMFRVVNDLLTYSKVIGDPEQHLQTLNCEEVVAEAVQFCGASIAETGASVTYGPLPEIVANKQQMVEVFQNLISNAIAYRRESVTPRVHITATEIAGGWEFGVTDNGIGIDTAFADVIFQPFKRLHGGEIPGTGLGLAICKRAIERHGGNIRVESKPGDGATFRFTLPSVACERPSPPSTCKAKA